MNIESSSQNIEFEQQDEKSKMANLTSLIEFEINRINSESSRPGWTVWAILGGMASAAWLLTSEIEKSQVGWENVIKLFVMFCVLMDVFKGLKTLLADNSSEGTQVARFGLAKSLFAQARVAILIEAIRSTFIFYVIKIGYIGLTSPYRNILLIYYGYTIFMVVVGLALSFTKQIISMNSPPNGWVWIIGIKFYNLLIVIGSVGFLYEKDLYELLFHMQEVRIAGLFMVVFLLSIVLTNPKAINMLLPQLINLRREVGLGNYNYQMASKQYELYLMGMRLSDVLKDDVKNIIDKLEQANGYLNNYVKEHEVLIEKQKGTHKDPSTDNIVINALEKSASTWRQKGMDSIKDAKVISTKLSKRIKTISILSNDISGDVLEIQNAIMEQISLIEGKVDTKYK